MAAHIAIPKLGMTMKEATLVEWKVKEGQWVDKGDVVLVIETEKTNWQVEASGSGFVHILLEEDAKAPVSRVVGLIAETEEELAGLQQQTPGEIYTTDVEAAEAAQESPSEALAVSSAAQVGTGALD
jgi:pyruvate dehydrogenase E2 component (dihydrolipoamide acetyltransferase)